MIDICVQRKGNTYHPFSEEDRIAGLVHPEMMFLRARISGSKKERAYRELCAYMGSCSYIAKLGINKNMDTKVKVDHLTRLKCGFVEGTVFDGKGMLHWIPKSLSYKNCDQPESHAFIKQAIEEHAALCGIDDVDVYLRHLKGEDRYKDIDDTIPEKGADQEAERPR
jgi:hypothetical protein